jgi:endonuclease YncB( thermonuclease family)
MFTSAMKNATSSCRAALLAVLAFTTFAILVAWCSPALSSAREQRGWSGVVTYVVDGDSIHVRPAGGGKPIHIRMDGLDAPEICQPGGRMARAALAHRALGRQVVVYGRRHDDYGRLLARVHLKNDDLGKWMVVKGHAWSYRHRKNPGPYAVQQRHAQAAGTGIFSPTHAAPAVYPGTFRKQHGTCYLP